ncbi:AAA family ATPase [Dyella choica]|uniref:AAA family ATPase n=1 Tax=Dyella choica TaxID=1927959 RepID=A0A432MBW1_9GAMM|nr:AAA family ATPase [Dyella choica]
MQLPDLGERICILGPSNSGKSTLANAIARKCGLKAIHLDQLYHIPNSNWTPRPPDEFVALHDHAIIGDQWVMDGNYSKCMPQRFLRATGLILLDVSMPLSLFRYARRTLCARDRVGTLEGARDSIKWAMIHHIAIVTPWSRRRYAEIYRQTPLPKIYLPSAQAIDQCYRHWSL